MTPNEDPCLVLKYRTVSRDVEHLARFIAAINSNGCARPLWDESSESLARRANVSKIDPSEGTFEIAFPMQADSGSISELLLSIFIDLHPVLYDSLVLEDLRLPAPMLARYTGPVWGTHLHSIYTAQKRPLLIGVIKPSYGLDAESHFQRAQDILIGGADVAKDDENLSAGEPANPLIKRIAMAREVIERAQEQTGLPKLYVLNLQHESMILGVLPMIETINAQHPHPILGILWSPVLGVPFIRMLRGETKAPVFCHSSGMAQFVGGRFSLSRRAYATVVRLAGADALIHSPPVEGAWATKLSDIHSLCDGAMREYGHLTSMLCCFGGGLAMDQVDRVSRAISYYNFGYLVGGAFLSGAGTPRGCAQALSQELVRVTQDLRLPIKQ